MDRYLDRDRIQEFSSCVEVTVTMKPLITCTLESDSRQLRRRRRMFNFIKGRYGSQTSNLAQYAPRI